MTTDDKKTMIYGLRHRKEFTMVTMRREKKKVEILIRDDLTCKETKVTLMDVELSSPYDVLGVYDAPESEDEVEVKGRDGNAYWVKLAPHARAQLRS
jgi:hypothetical protein